MSEVSVVSEEPIACGSLLGPLPSNPDALALLTWRCSDERPKQLLKVGVKEEGWLCRVLPARNPHEQTLEVVAKGGQLYFRATRHLSAGEELRAWFGPELSDILKLPVIPPTVVEGEKRYECALCQEQFENPFPVVAHLMYRCRQRDSLPPATVKKRNGVKNFDIATLTDMGDEGRSPASSSVREESPDRNTESIPEPKFHDDPSPNRTPEAIPESKSKPHTVLRDKPSNDSPNDVEDLANGKHRRRSDNPDVYSSPPKKLKGDRKPPEYSPTSSPRKGPFEPTFRGIDVESNSTSAFKKVDKSSGQSFHSGVSSLSSLFVGGGLDPRDLLFQNNFAPFHPYSIGNQVTSGSPYATHPGISSQSHPGIPLDTSSAFAAGVKLPGGMHQQLNKLSSGAPVSLQMKMADELKGMRKLHEGHYELGSLSGARPPGLPTPLMPFLPPSLAALTFPSQNWCARCNAHFRMTSDLVYHMRSHHKRESDPGRMRREEKLRCNICNETFRERHHLTRHMTSHQ